jgi:hypothetical protein
MTLICKTFGNICQTKNVRAEKFFVSKSVPMVHISFDVFNLGPKKSASQDLPVFKEGVGRHLHRAALVDFSFTK